MQFRIRLDGNFFDDEPIGFKDLTTSITRDKSVKGILKTVELTLKFRGDAYDYLKSVMQLGAYEIVECVIQRSSDEGLTWIPFYKGIIRIADGEDDERKQLFSVKITDDSFYALINNNNDIGAYPTAGRSKNDYSIDPVTIAGCKIYLPADGIYFAEKLKCLNVVDTLRYLIEYVTDGQLQFRSDYLTASNLWSTMVMTYGRMIRMNIDPAYTVTDDQYKKYQPTISFKQIFQYINSKDPIGFIIDESTSPPTFRVEDRDYFRDTTTLLSIGTIDSIKTKTASDELYSKIVVGGQDSPEEVYLNYFNELPVVGWKKEEFTLLGQANTSVSLDIVSDVAVHSNVIEKILVDNAATTYDQETTWDDVWIFIEADSVGTDDYEARKTNWLNTPAPYYYNENLNNENTLQRWFNGIPNSIASYLADDVNKFRVSNSAVYGFGAFGLLIPPIEFDDNSTPPNFDTSSLWDTGNYYYNVPTDGIYTFHFYLKTEIFGVGSTRIRVIRYDNTFTTIVGGKTAINRSGQVGTITYDGLCTIYCKAGEKVVCDIRHDVAGDLLLGSYFESINAGAGGVYAVIDSNSYPTYRHEFTYPLSLSQADLLRSNPNGVIEFAMQGQAARKGWIESVKINENSGVAKFVLSSTKNLNA